jgi:hypothetical protein
MIFRFPFPSKSANQQTSSTAFCTRSFIRSPATEGHHSTSFNIVEKGKGNNMFKLFIFETRLAGGENRFLRDGTKP